MGGGGGGATQASVAETVVLGGLAGSVAEACVQPALVVRTRMMVQGVDASVKSYSSFFHAVRDIASTEGIGGFYKGGSVNMLFTPAARGLYMAGVDGTKAYLGEDSAIKNFVAGMNGQLLASVAYVPSGLSIHSPMEKSCIISRA